MITVPTSIQLALFFLPTQRIVLLSVYSLLYGLVCLYLKVYRIVCFIVSHLILSEIFYWENVEILTFGYYKKYSLYPVSNTKKRFSEPQDNR